MIAADAITQSRGFSVLLTRELQALNSELIAKIEKALAEVGPDGEVSLLIEDGQLLRLEKLTLEVIELNPS